MEEMKRDQYLASQTGHYASPAFFLCARNKAVRRIERFLRAISEFSSDIFYGSVRIMDFAINNDLLRCSPLPDLFMFASYAGMDIMLKMLMRETKKVPEFKTYCGFENLIMDQRPGHYIDAQYFRVNLNRTEFAIAKALDYNFRIITPTDFFNFAFITKLTIHEQFFEVFDHFVNQCAYSIGLVGMPAMVIAAAIVTMMLDDRPDLKTSVPYDVKQALAVQGNEGELHDLGLLIHEFICCQ